MPAFARTGAAVLFMALGIIASLLLPFSALAVDAAIGAWLSTFTQRNWLAILTQTALLGGRLLISLLGLWVGALTIFKSSVTLPGTRTALLLTSTPIRWVGALFGLTEGDWGLTFLHQAHTQVLWADIRAGVLINGAALLYVLTQFGVAVLILRQAIRRAERPAFR